MVGPWKWIYLPQNAVHESLHLQVCSWVLKFKLEEFKQLRSLHLLTLLLILFADRPPVSRGTPAVMQSSPSENAGLDQNRGVEGDINLLIFRYEQLKVVADNPITAGIDVAKREVSLASK